MSPGSWLLLAAISVHWPCGMDCSSSTHVVVHFCVSVPLTEIKPLRAGPWPIWLPGFPVTCNRHSAWNQWGREGTHLSQTPAQGCLLVFVSICYGVGWGGDLAECYPQARGLWKRLRTPSSGEGWHSGPPGWLSSHPRWQQVKPQGMVHSTGPIAECPRSRPGLSCRTPHTTAHQVLKEKSQSHITCSSPSSSPRVSKSQTYSDLLSSLHRCRYWPARAALTKTTEPAA